MKGVLAAKAVGARAVLEVNAPVIDHPGSSKARLDRALLVRPMQRWRDHVCRHADLFVTPSARILPAWVPRERVAELEWGADTERFRPGACGPVPFQRREGEMVAVFAGAFRAWHGAIGLARAVAELDASGIGPVHAVFVGDGPERPRTREAASTLARATFTGALPYDLVPACLAAADVGVAPFDAAAHPPLQLDFYWSPLKVFEYMASGLPVLAPRIPRLAALVSDGVEGCLYAPADPSGLAGALRTALDAGRRRSWVSPHARAPSATTAGTRTARGWTRHCGSCRVGVPPRDRSTRPARDRRVPARLWGQRVEHLRVGARSREALGHDVLVVKPRPGTPSGTRETSYDGFPVVEIGSYAPAGAVPPELLQERTAARRRWVPQLAEIAASRGTDVIHGQHVLTAPAAVAAGARAGVPVACTVRDYWPVCYWADLIHDRHADHLCPACSASMMTQCVRPRAGGAWPLALPLIPYMRGNLARKRAALARADAVIAVSTAIARDLRERAPELSGTRLEVIPNPVDTDALMAATAGSPAGDTEPYAVFVGQARTQQGRASPRSGARRGAPALARGGGRRRQSASVARSRRRSGGRAADGDGVAAARAGTAMGGRSDAARCSPRTGPNR